MWLELFRQLKKVTAKHIIKPLKKNVVVIYDWKKELGEYQISKEMFLLVNYEPDSA